MVVAAGSLAVPIDNLGSLLAASATFAAAVAVDDALAVPADRVHYHANAETLVANQLERPFAILWFDDFTYADIGEGDGYYLQAGGSIVCRMQFESTEAVNDDAAIEALNFFGGVLDDLATISGSDDNLPFNSVFQVSPPTRTSREMMESDGMDFWEATYRFQYGHR